MTGIKCCRWTVDDVLYVKSEEDQELYLGKIQANVSKIMMGAGR